MANIKEQKIWRKNFSIRQVYYQFVTPAILDMINYQPPIFSNILREFVWVQKEDDNIATYVAASQLRRFIDRTINIIQSQPQLINDIHQETIKRTRDYFKYSASLLKINLPDLSTSELIKIYKKLIYHQMFHRLKLIWLNCRYL